MLFRLQNALSVLLLFAAASRASDCQISASKAYVKAIVSHSEKDAAAIPLERDVVRYEGPPGFSVESAHGEEDLRKSVTSGPSSYTVNGASNERYTSLNATTVEAIYTIKVGLLQGTLPLTTAKVEEYFTFRSATACIIQRIDAIFYVGQK